MLGAIIGDVVGSRFEFDNNKSMCFDLVTDECEFTDDTILTVALMDWALHAKIRDSYSVTEYLQKWGRKYPSSYGVRFEKWLYSDNPKPYGSYGNGAGMRVSPVAYIAKTERELFFLSDLVTSVTHNHHDGIEGARAIAFATWLALHNIPKESVWDVAIGYYPEIKTFQYNQLVEHYKFNELSKNTCPQALFCFLKSDSFEDCLRMSVSVGGDTDTLCAMSCAIAEAYYKYVPNKLKADVLNKLPQEMKDIIVEFEERYEPDSSSKTIDILRKQISIGKMYCSYTKEELKMLPKLQDEILQKYKNETIPYMWDGHEWQWVMID